MQLLPPNSGDSFSGRMLLESSDSQGAVGVEEFDPARDTIFFVVITTETTTGT